MESRPTNTPGDEGPATASRGAGLSRMALAGAVAVLLVLGWPPPGAATAYLAAGLALVFGALLASGRPEVLARRPLPRLVLDSLLLSLLVAGTGGGDSPFFPLYFLAALGVARVSGPAGVACAAVVLAGGYAAAAVAAGGPGTLGSVPVGLGVVFVAVFCAAVGLLGSGACGLAERDRGLSSALVAERDRVSRAEGLVSGFGPTLKNSSLEEILRWTVGAAREAGGGTYAHVAALEGNRHRTVLGTDVDACPSWWHPSIQRLVLWSCREGEAVRSGEEIHGIRGFVAVPIRLEEGVRWGAVVVGGGELGVGEGRALQLISGVAAPAFGGVGHAPG